MRLSLTLFNKKQTAEMNLLLLVSILVGSTSAQTFAALGDSLCAGTMGDMLVTDDAYTDDLFAHLQQEEGYDILKKLCCPGEDSNEFLNGSYVVPPSDGSFCYGNTTMDQLDSQLDGTIALIQADDVQLVTISIGSNDFIACLLGPSDEAQSCIEKRTSQFLANMNKIITNLQNTTEAPIVAMTPYNPFLAYLLSDNPADQLLAIGAEQLLVSVVSALNQNVYEPLGVHVVDANLVFDGLNRTGDPPQNVVSICENTLMCYRADNGTYVLEDASVRDIHANEAGYQKLADAHIALLENVTFRPGSDHHDVNNFIGT